MRKPIEPRSKAKLYGLLNGVHVFFTEEDAYDPAKDGSRMVCVGTCAYETFPKDTWGVDPLSETEPKDIKTVFREAWSTTPPKAPVNGDIRELQDWLETFRLQEENLSPLIGIPTRWMRKPTYRCVSGHVSTDVLHTHSQGDLCKACKKSCLLTFPEDTEDKETA